MTDTVNFEYFAEMEPHVRKVMGGEYGVGVLPANPVILDLGANIGAFAVWAKNIWPDAEVHSFEPMDFNIQVFKRNTAGLEGVHLHEMAVGNPYLDSMFIGKNNQGECSQYQTESTTDELINVEVCDPDCNFFRNLAKRADFIKLDIEGAETYVLANMPLEAEYIALEYHGEEARRDVDRLLHNYHLIGAEVTATGYGVLKYQKTKR
jgi:FkbM family methyltransferase